MTNSSILSITQLVQKNGVDMGLSKELYGFKITGANVQIEKPYTRDVDIMILLDCSWSMIKENKMVEMKASIQHVVDSLNPRQRLGLITFNEGYKTNQELLPMDETNKANFKKILESIKCEGSTNISTPLFFAMRLLYENMPELKEPVVLKMPESKEPIILLFTDGRANAGLRGNRFFDAFKSSPRPDNLIIHTFGYGPEHDSDMLTRIANATNGRYHFIQNAHHAATTISDCVSYILTPIATGVKVQLECFEGARLTRSFVGCPVKETKPSKTYEYDFGTICAEEEKNILFDMSLRKVEIPTSDQSIVVATVAYINTLTGKLNSEQSTIRITRTPSGLVKSRHVTTSEINYQKIRYDNGIAMKQLVTCLGTKNYSEMIDCIADLKTTIECELNSSMNFVPKGAQPKRKIYYESLLSDLKIITDALGKIAGINIRNENVLIATIKHFLYAYSTRDLQERDNGIEQSTQIEITGKMMVSPVPRTTCYVNKQQLNMRMSENVHNAYTSHYLMPDVANDGTTEDTKGATQSDEENDDAMIL